MEQSSDRTNTYENYLKWKDNFSEKNIVTKEKGEGRRGGTAGVGEIASVVENVEVDADRPDLLAGHYT